MVVGILLAFAFAIGLGGLFLGVGTVIALRQRQQRPKLLRAAAESTQLTHIDESLRGRREGLEVAVTLKEGVPHLFELNFGEHRIASSFRFLALRRGKRWPVGWGMGMQLVNLNLNIDRLASFQVEDWPGLQRIMREPEVEEHFARLLELPGVGVVGVDRRDVFAVLVEADTDSLDEIIDGAVALCHRLTAVAPAGGRASHRLGAGGPSGSPFGIPGVAPPRRTD